MTHSLLYTLSQPYGFLAVEAQTDEQSNGRIN